MLCEHMLGKIKTIMIIMKKFKSYSELIQYSTFDDRLKYLTLNGSIGDTTFGFDRYINQQFYSSKEWKDIRREVIIRDNGCDLGVFGCEINTNFLVHHINPIDASDIIHNDLSIFDPEFLITTTKETHNTIHYGSELKPKYFFVERSTGDTALW